MRICENGVIRDMTEEEEQFYKTPMDKQQSNDEVTIEERVARVENRLDAIENPSV